MNYVIIGNSAAGISAAEAIRLRDAEGAITVVTEEDAPPYSRCLITYRLADLVVPETMLFREEDFYGERGIDLMRAERASRIDTEKRRLVLASGKKIPYDRLLLATGGAPKMPRIPGIEKEGVSAFRTLADLERISGLLEGAKSAVVLGGGCIGLQTAYGLHAQGLKVTVAIKSPHLLSQVSDAEGGRIFQRLFEENGIRVVTGADAAEVLGGERVEAVRLETGEEIPCDLLVVGKGVSPSIELAEATSIETHWGFIVDGRLQTSVPGIYAAGDCAETRDVVTEEETVNALWPCAAEQGRIAGANMAGESRTYDGSMRMNAVDFFGVAFISLGVVKPEGEGYEILSSRGPGENRYLKAVLKDNAIVGAVLAGDIARAGLFRDLMRRKADVSSLKDALLAPRFNYAKILPLIEAQKEKFDDEEHIALLLTHKKR